MNDLMSSLITELFDVESHYLCKVYDFLPNPVIHQVSCVMMYLLLFVFTRFLNSSVFVYDMDIWVLYVTRIRKFNATSWLFDFDIYISL